MVESEIESDSTKKNEFYQKKIERITDDYENQTRRKNQELDEIFEEITLENDNLRKELLLTKEELEGEIEKNIDIKNSIYNFNYFTKKTSKELDEKLGKDKNIKEDYTNSIFCDYLNIYNKPNYVDILVSNLTNNFKEQVEIYKKRKENYLKEKNNKNGIRDSNISLYSNRESNPDGGRKTGPSGEVIEEDPNEYTVDGNTKGSIGRFFSGIFK